MSVCFFCQDSESGLGIEIEDRQPECQHKPHLTSRANLAVVFFPFVVDITYGLAVFLILENMLVTVRSMFASDGKIVRYSV